MLVSAPTLMSSLATMPIHQAHHSYHPNLHPEAAASRRGDSNANDVTDSSSTDLRAALMADPDNVEAKAMLHARSQTIDKVCISSHSPFVMRIAHRILLHSNGSILITYTPFCFALFFSYSAPWSQFDVLVAPFFTRIGSRRRCTATPRAILKAIGTDIH